MCFLLLLLLLLLRVVSCHGSRPAPVAPPGSNTIPQFKMLVQDVEDVFDRDDDGLIDLHEFVFGMTFLNELASRVSRTTDYYVRVPAA